ncbi:hypothetical protein GGR53DRAFT_472160 [Hypoxylon sp. FL1150]|nr:hypothetical protein GGR53DRAFT_472160 [Hypoxylon sp. FL1150]
MKVTSVSLFTCDGTPTPTTPDPDPSLSSDSKIGTAQKSMLRSCANLTLTDNHILTAGCLSNPSSSSSSSTDRDHATLDLGGCFANYNASLTFVGSNGLFNNS